MEDHNCLEMQLQEPSHLNTRSALKAGSHIIAANVSIAAVNSKSGLTIGTII